MRQSTNKNMVFTFDQQKPQSYSNFLMKPMENPQNVEKIALLHFQYFNLRFDKFFQNLRLIVSIFEL